MWNENGRDTRVHDTVHEKVAETRGDDEGGMGTERYEQTIREKKNQSLEPYIEIEKLFS